jgi:hypothetical protein
LENKNFGSDSDSGFLKFQLGSGTGINRFLKIPVNTGINRFLKKKISFLYIYVLFIIGANAKGILGVKTPSKIQEK